MLAGDRVPKPGLARDQDGDRHSGSLGDAHWLSIDEEVDKLRRGLHSFSLASTALEELRIHDSEPDRQEVSPSRGRL